MRVARSGLLPALLSLLASCSGAGDRVVVCSGASTEQRILGEVLAQQIERRAAVPVRRKLGLTGALACRRAQGSGKIDVYPEYTLTALVDVLRHRAVADPRAVLNLVAREYSQRFRVAWLPSLGPEGRIAPVARNAALTRYPRVRAALDELGGRLPDSTLSRLVAEVDRKGLKPADAAREFLEGRRP